MIRLRGYATTCSLLGMLWIAPCSPAHVSPPGPGDPSPTKLPEGMDVQTEDRNRDGKPDKWTECSILGGLKRCEKIDLNFDGKVDVVREYDDDGKLVSEKRDLDYDGKIDDERIFKAGVIVEEHSGFGFDGKFHHFTYFENGKKVREEIDVNQDGSIDEWHWFDENEKLIRVGIDTDGDGKPDQFRR